MNDNNYATAQDAVNLVSGNKYTARLNKQPLGWWRDRSSAVLEATRQGGIPYEIVREGPFVYVREIIIGESKMKTPAELIAAEIRKQLGVKDDEPISPLAKQRTIVLLNSFCNGDESSIKSAFLEIFPYSNEEQFYRLYTRANDAPKPSSNSILEEFAKNNSLVEELKLIMSGDEKLITTAIYSGMVKSNKLTAILDKSRNLGVLDSSQAEKISRIISKADAQERLERTLGSDVLRIIESNRNIALMSNSGNAQGISEILIDEGYDESDAECMAEEIVALSGALCRMK